MKGETGKGSSEIAKGRRRERERWKAPKSQEKSGFFNKTRLFLKIIRSLDSKFFFFPCNNGDKLRNCCLQRHTVTLSSKSCKNQLATHIL